MTRRVLVVLLACSLLGNLATCQNERRLRAERESQDEALGAILDREIVLWDRIRDLQNQLRR